MVELNDLLEAFKDLRDYSACNNCVYQKKKECVEGNFCIWNDIEKMLKILQIIFEAPSIIEQLFKLGQLGKKAEDRYYWGTITDSKVEKVKEFFADGKRDQSK